MDRAIPLTLRDVLRLADKPKYQVIKMLLSKFKDDMSEDEDESQVSNSKDKDD